MEDKKNYTPQEVAEIAKSYLEFWRYESSYNMSEEIRKRQKNDLLKIMDKIPQNVRTCLNLGVRTIIERIGNSGIDH